MVPSIGWKPTGQPQSRMVGLMSHSILPKKLYVVLLAAGLAAVLSAEAAAPAANGAATACSAAEYRQLDDWIGDWDTFEADTPNGASIARAHIARIAAGCALHELYEQSDGLIGDSILSYDAVRRQWQQTWVTNRGSLMVIHGGMKEGALVLEGEVHLQDGRTVLQRISWKTEEQGVREWAVLSKDEGKTWTPAFDVHFRRHR